MTSPRTPNRWPWKEIDANIHRSDDYVVLAGLKPGRETDGIVEFVICHRPRPRWKVIGHAADLTAAKEFAEAHRRNSRDADPF